MKTLIKAQASGALATLCGMSIGANGVPWLVSLGLFVGGWGLYFLAHEDMRKTGGA
jgi:hypothetical protein